MSTEYRIKNAGSELVADRITLPPGVSPETEARLATWSSRSGLDRRIGYLGIHAGTWVIRIVWGPDRDYHIGSGSTLESAIVDALKGAPE